MTTLRPAKLNDIIGQVKVKECLNVLLKAYKGIPMPHMLWTGPPGTGKTTFATAVANSRGSKIYLANGGTIRSSKDILPYLVRLKTGDILFIDEIHRMDVRVQESLFTVMEDFRYDIAKGAKSLQLDKFTLIGATTDAGMLLQPFYDRFKHHFQLQSYSYSEIESLIMLNSKKLGKVITAEAANGLAKRARFTPRIANSLLEWCSDYAKAVNKNVIDETVVDLAMSLKEIDRNGLDKDDHRYISVLKRSGRPMGLSTLAASTNIAKCTIENRIEPYLIRRGVIEKTPKGRELCTRT